MLTSRGTEDGLALETPDNCLKDTVNQPETYAHTGSMWSREGKSGASSASTTKGTVLYCLLDGARGGNLVGHKIGDRGRMIEEGELQGGEVASDKAAGLCAGVVTGLDLLLLLSSRPLSWGMAGRPELRYRKPGRRGCFTGGAESGLWG